MSELGAAALLFFVLWFFLGWWLGSITQYNTMRNRAHLKNEEFNALLEEVRTLEEQLMARGEQIAEKQMEIDALKSSIRNGGELYRIHPDLVKRGARAKPESAQEC